MTKIIAGVTGLVATVALVGTVAFANFSATVSANNVVFATGTASLQAKYGTTNWGSLFDLGTASNNFGKFVPGQPKSDTFFVRNIGDVPLTLNLRLVSAPTGQWGTLKDVMQLKVYPSSGSETDYKTFAQWNVVGGVNLGVVLPAVPDTDAGVEMTVKVQLAPEADNSFADKSVTTNWVLTGTQTDAPTPTPSPSVAPSVSPSVSPSVLPSPSVEVSPSPSAS